MKFAVLGAGSSYTPELIEGLATAGNDLSVKEIAFQDINEERLDIMTNFCRRYADHLGFNVKITPTLDRREAINGAEFIDVQVRVGGNSQRIVDEKIPLKYGLVGQETTGPGGMLKAFRTIPVMLEIARDVQRYNPEAWIINYTNPAGLVTEAVTKHTAARIAGLCSGGLFPQWHVAETLGVPKASVRYSYVGLNHLNFAYNIKVDGRLITDEEFDRVSEVVAYGALSPAYIRVLRLIPSPYLQYFFDTAKKMQELREAPLTRGEEVLLLEQEVLDACRDPSCNTKPPALEKRGGGGYSEVALSVMRAIHTNQEKIIIVNVPNKGAIDFLPADAVVEIPCVVSSAGIEGINIPDVPRAVWGIIAAVKNYEQLAVEAAVTGSREVALMALMAHPLVHDYEIAAPLLDELLEANRQFLPAFFNGMK